MNKIISIIIVILIIVGGAYLIKNKAPNTGDTSSMNDGKVTGRVVFSVTDAAADMSAISKISMKVSKVDVHNETSGWITVSSTPKVYSLLDLNVRNESELLADIQMENGTYNQVRLMVDAVTIETKDGFTKIAKLPSGELKINTKLVVEAGKTASVNFDFLANKSLHATGKGEYIFAPVVKTETKSNAEVSISTNGIVQVSGGNTDNTNTVGMDIDGSIKLDFQINGNQKINLDSNNKIKIDGNVLPTGIVCTEEAKQCPDGSYVGRTGPKCEFAKCPQ